MRFKIHKRNALIFVLVALIALCVVIRIRKNENVHQEINKDVASPASATSKFQYDTVFNMKKSVYGSNYRQFIHNADKFSADPQLVIVVQVHKRPAYLKLLVDSLEKVLGVHNMLLIFSQDYFSEEIAREIERIDFCRVLQIYFPYSTQLYPAEFPGQDPKDCPRDISKDSAIKMNCNNAEYPDSYGHYRESAFTQAKHHWWWKLHFVWERVRILQGYTGYVLFIEEDNYLLPDFYHVFEGMAALKKKECPDCDMLVLGNHDDATQLEEFADKVETSGWLSTRHNIGMAMPREMYYKLMGCNAEFCTYDDYNWDWTLQHLSGSCISKSLKVLAAKTSRVLHTGNCGMHHNQDCQPEVARQRIKGLLALSQKFLFPSSLIVNSQQPVEHKNNMINGGWGDIRDHALCKTYANIL